MCVLCDYGHVSAGHTELEVWIPWSSRFSCEQPQTGAGNHTHGYMLSHLSLRPSPRCLELQRTQKMMTTDGETATVASDGRVELGMERVHVGLRALPGLVLLT